MNKKQRKSKRKHQRTHKGPLLRQQPPESIKPALDTPRKSRTGQPSPLWTKTGELFQPVRLYYALRKPQKIQQCLQNLRCVQFESARNQWFWLYTGEASPVSLNKKAGTLKKPVELGSMSFFGERGMFLDVHSVERALAAMVFFDQHLPRRLAKFSHLSIANSLFDSHGAHAFQFPLCAKPDAQARDPILSLLKTLDKLNKRGRTLQEKQDAVTSYLHTMPTPPFPRIEHLVIRFSRKKQRQIRFLLESRQYVAIQRWKGNDQISLADYVRTLIETENGLILGR
jgi:hypothetical protein